MNSQALFSSIRQFAYNTWCWWRLYSRLSQRINYHLGSPLGGFSIIVGKAGVMYAFFEGSFLLVLFQIPLGGCFSVGQWLVFYFFISTVIILRDWNKFTSGVDDKSIEDCNQLRQQGYWYPEWMTSTLGRRSLWVLIFVFLQFILTCSIVILSMKYFT